MNCREIRSQLEQGIAAGSAVLPEAVERHVAQCEECREAYRLIRQTSAWLHLSREAVPEPSPAFWPRFRARLAEREREPAWTWVPIDVYARRLVYGLAGLVFVLGLSLVFLEGRATPEPRALLEFDSPPPTERIVPTSTNGPFDRDQVMLTLAAAPER